MYVQPHHSHRTEELHQADMLKRPIFWTLLCSGLTFWVLTSCVQTSFEHLSTSIAMAGNFGIVVALGLVELCAKAWAYVERFTSSELKLDTLDGAERGSLPAERRVPNRWLWLGSANYAFMSLSLGSSNAW